METPTRPTLALEIDAVADQFEAAWKAGGRPDPGEYLTGVAEPAARNCWWNWST